MATYAQLEAEPWWRAEKMSPTMQTLATRLQGFFGVGPMNIGAKGDNAPGHMQGAHRSRAWIQNSRYCTNRLYTVSETQGNRTGGDSNWLAGMDITVPSAQLLPMCQRLDVAVRAGLLEKVTEWYGNKDGDSRVDGYNNIRDQIASSDLSHLWHLHLTFDRGRAGEDHSDLYAVLTGTAPITAEEDMIGLVRLKDDPKVYLYENGMRRRWIASEQELADVRYLSSSGQIPPLANGGQVAVVDRIEAYGELVGEVTLELSDEELERIAEAAERGAEAGAPTEAELVAAAEKGANLAEDA